MKVNYCNVTQLLFFQFSLYYNEVLSKQAPPGDMKQLLAKTTVDLYGKYVMFCIYFQSVKGS